nr:MAG TPA: hypothetical protein [Caudoviricetes sp.]
MLYMGEIPRGHCCAMAWSEMDSKKACSARLGIGVIFVK